jgi:UDP-3-O-[3-hydroxymyristoyl] glucosamine N-acyltransferase
MEFTASQIAGFLKGTVEGDPDLKVNKLAKIEEAGPGSLTFLTNPAYTHFIYTTGASVVLVNDQFKPEQPLSCTLIRVKDPYASLAQLLDLYKKSQPEAKGISPLAFIPPSASLGENVYVGPFVCVGEHVVIGKDSKIHPGCFIGDHVSIGENTTLFSGVRIYQECIIGNDCTLHANSVVGADGFGFAPQDDNNYRKIAQIGNVVIEDKVEIGAGTCIDRATLGSTVISRGVKLDNLIQVGHNVQIGENTVIAAQCGIAGSSKVGRNCMIGGQVGISGHLIIGDNVKIAAQTGLTSNIKDNTVIMGSPAMEASRYKKAFIHFRNFEKIVKRIDELEAEIKKLKG